MRKYAAIAMLAASMVGLGATAWGATTYTSYNTTVGKINGKGYSGYQVKSVAGAEGTVKSTTVGGNYFVDARLEGGGVNGKWTRIGDNDQKQLLNGIASGVSSRVAFSNDLTTRVDVQVVGSFRAY